MSKKERGENMAKIMTCVATLDNKVQIENLKQCIEIIGGKPIVDKNIVSACAEYPSDLATHLLLLYDNYWRHEITITEK